MLIKKARKVYIVFFSVGKIKLLRKYHTLKPQYIVVKKMLITIY